MKAKNGFNLRQVCGENIIVAEGKENIDFSNIISMNESSAFLWKEVQNLPSFTVDDMVRILTDAYDVDEDTARKDATTLASQWGTAGIIEGDDVPVTEESATLSEDNTHISKEAPKEEKKGFFKKLFK